MDFKVNANMGVKVKLTDYGISILEKQRNDLNDYIESRGGMRLSEFELELDEDGYYSTQLWMLMRDFGNAMMMGSKMPFDIDIIIEKGRPI